MRYSCVRLGTLTYASPCFDVARLRSDVARFFKRIRRELGREPIPYAWVQEWHPGGHGLHVHFAVGQYVRHTLIRDAWQRGIVDIRRITPPPGSGGWREAERVAARYLAKYVSKSGDAAREMGTHRYEVAQGFQPRSLRFFDRTQDAVIERASAEMGAPPAYIWRSATDHAWTGPPSCWCVW